jgi:MYXO-CTERM domain-containing protein
VSLLSLPGEVWAHRPGSAPTPSAEGAALRDSPPLHAEAEAARIGLDVAAVSPAGARQVSAMDARQVSAMVVGPHAPHASPQGRIGAATTAETSTGRSQSRSDLVADQDAAGRGAQEQRAWFSTAPDQGVPVHGAVALAALVLGVAVRQSRRAVALALILLLALFAFETGFHSVHHAPDSPEADACAFASAAAHLAVADTADLIPALLLPPALADGPHADLALALASAHLPPRDRAPPVPLA